MFWQSQAETGNQIAQTLFNAIADIPETDLLFITEIVNPSINNYHGTNEPLNNQKQQINGKKDSRNDRTVKNNDRCLIT